MKKFVILLLSLVAFPVFAADWMDIGNKAYVDLSSIKTENGYVYAWIKVMDGAAMKPVNGKKVGHYMSYDAYNCDNKKSRNESIITYGFDGKSLARNDNLPANSTWKNVAPETKEEIWLNAICKASTLPRQEY